VSKFGNISDDGRSQKARAPSAILQVALKAHATARSANRRWSAAVTRHSNALDLEPSVFKKSSVRAIALSLIRSAERSTRRKASPFQSAMSMLNFYLNRAGSNLPVKQKSVLAMAKNELRKAYHRDQA
jgi:predicted HNH restriction endonuclease